MRDSIEGIDVCPTSDDLLDLTALPAEAAVIGGGYIAVEFASFLARLGVRVCQFYRDRLPLRGFDEDLRTRAAAAMQPAGIELHPGGSAALRAARAGDGYALIALDERVREFAVRAECDRPAAEHRRARARNDRHRARQGRRGAGRRATAHQRARRLRDRRRDQPEEPDAGRDRRRPRARRFAVRRRRRARSTCSLVASAVFMLPPIATIGPSEADALTAGQRREGLRSRLPADAPGLRRQRRAQLHEAAGRRATPTA